MNKFSPLIVLFLSIYLVGCGNAPIIVERADPEVVEAGSETLDIRNCDSIDDMITTLESHAPVKQHISISETATSEKTGSAIDIPSDLIDELILQVESVYQGEFEEALANAEQVEFTIPGDKIHMYKIRWIQQIYSATISASINGQPSTASYVYTLETPDLDSLTTMSCTA